MKLKQGINQFIHGFRDSYQGCVQFVKKTRKSTNKNESKLYQRLLQSCILNGVFLFVCILLFNHVIVPILNYIVFRFLSESNYNSIASNLNTFINLLFSFVWIMPVFLLSKIFNVLCYQDIADMAYTREYGKPKIYANSSFSAVIADTIFSCVLQFIFLIQSSIMNYVPIYLLNKILHHLHIAMLYSLYAFEYKWFNMGWDINKRLTYIETHWPYFIGFGLSLSVITTLPDQYILSATLFAFLFPAFLLSAVHSDVRDRHNEFTSLNLFYPCVQITDILFRFIEEWKNKRKASRQQQQQQHENTFKIKKKN